MANDTILMLYRNHGFMYEKNYKTFVHTVKKLGYKIYVLTHTGDKISDEDIHSVDYFEFCDLSNLSSAREKVKKICSFHRIFRLFAFTEWDVYLGSLCREDNNIDGLKPGDCICFRDKNVMHVRAKEIGIRVPEFCIPHTLQTIKDFVKKVDYPIIIKPYDGAGSVRTYSIFSEEDLVKTWAAVRNERHDYKVEKFIKGIQFFIDTLIKNNRVVFEMLSQYTYSVVNYRKEIPGGITIRNNTSEKLKEMLRINQKLLAGFNIGTGISHSEFFLTESGEIFLGETASRFGGGPITMMVKEGFGINNIEEWVKLDLIPEYEAPDIKEGPFIGIEYFSSDMYNCSGKIVSISDKNELMVLDSVVAAHILKKKDDYISDPQDCSDILGFYICKGESFEDVLHNFKHIRPHFYVKTENNSPQKVLMPIGMDK